ncbi:hypothetical protein [Bifidobacterium vansinderenii]|uniref:Uncharacterized protein n=1 Tax=Bifidobacterium vansinderenii TaxID=1984871 RepID=A0A229VW81_9BIFI|nr:hypothetical protein [Bifidobacterium vansinderenii]OXM99887.1 hypothetical protein Tam10B_1850 [Bifidobacterium vansinderenii]
MAFGRLRGAVERSIRAAKKAGRLDLDANAAMLCSIRYQADLIDAEHGDVSYNVWRTFNSTCAQLGFDIQKNTSSAQSTPTESVAPRNDFEEFLSRRKA